MMRPRPRSEDLHGMLEALRAPAVEIRFTALDSFTEMERGLIFAAVERTDALQALHDRVAALCRAAGLDLPAAAVPAACHADAREPK